MSGMKRKTKKNGRPIIHSTVVITREPIKRMRLIFHGFMES
jgi:hypothetical protein